MLARPLRELKEREDEHQISAAPGRPHGLVHQHMPGGGMVCVLADNRQRVVMRPPSMTKSAPVMLPARSLARRRTRSATSSGWVNRPVTDSRAAFWATASGAAAAARATVAATPSIPSHSPVLTGPGLTVVTRIPRDATSFDSDLEKLARAALAAL